MFSVCDHLACGQSLLLVLGNWRFALCSQHIRKRGLQAAEGVVTRVTGQQPRCVEITEVAEIDRLMPEGGVARELDRQQHGVEAQHDPRSGRNVLGGVEHRAGKHDGLHEKSHELADILDKNTQR